MAWPRSRLRRGLWSRSSTTRCDRSRSHDPSRANSPFNDLLRLVQKSFAQAALLVLLFFQSPATNGAGPPGRLLDSDYRIKACFDCGELIPLRRSTCNHITRHPFTEYWWTPEGSSAEPCS